MAHSPYPPAMESAASLINVSSWVGCKLALHRLWTDVCSALMTSSRFQQASADYALVQLAGVPLFWLTAALQTVCDGLQRTQYGFWSTVLSASVQVILTVVFVYPKAMNVGFLGMAAARSSAGLVQLIAIIVMIKKGGIAPQVWGLGKDPSGSTSSAPLAADATAAAAAASVTVTTTTTAAATPTATAATAAIDFGLFFGGGGGSCFWENLFIVYYIQTDGVGF